MGEYFFWYGLTPVVPDKIQSRKMVVVVVVVVISYVNLYQYFEVFFLLFYVQLCRISALMLLVGQQKVHPTCKNEW